MDITLPTIHSNGTSRRSLQEDYEAASHALSDFIDKWEYIEFNARDYYVVPGAWQKAVEEREEISQNIRDIRTYIQTIRNFLDA